MSYIIYTYILNVAITNYIVCILPRYSDHRPHTALLNKVIHSTMPKYQSKSMFQAGKKKRKCYFASLVVLFFSCCALCVR